MTGPPTAWSSLPASPGQAVGLVELGRARDPIRLGVGGTEPGTEPHPQRGWDCRWLPPTPVREFKLARLHNYPHPGRELECFSRCGKRDRRLAS
jgi:hypothetical protein